MKRQICQEICKIEQYYKKCRVCNDFDEIFHKKD